MTTILADRRLGVMVADSNISDGDRAWRMKKIHRVHGMLVGLAGTVGEFALLLEWVRGGMAEAPDFKFDNAEALILSDTGLYLVDMSTNGRSKVSRGYEAIGTGGMGAICAYEALGYTDPTRAVRIACKHDASSRPPIRTYRLRPA